MKRLIALFLCVFGLLAAPLRADVELSFDFYYDQLSPLGEWVEVDGYGYVWHPNDVDADWAPYIDGYWTYTDAGWTWVSYEDWGAICYHYGRWVHLEDYGWCWVPGYEWGPAWVSWRKNDEYIGWAPLPPEVEWEPDRGVSVWVDVHYDIGPRWYSFCRTRDFGAPVLRHVLLPRIRNVDFCFSTINITNISYNRDYGCVYNGGFDYDYIRARCDRPVPALKLVQNTTNIFINNNRGNVVVNSPRGNTLVVASPRVAANAKNFTRKPAIRRSFKRDAVTRGWAGLDKPETRERLLGKMREETKGLSPANAPARPVKKEALAAVPKEVDLKARPVGLKRLPAERAGRGAAGREVAGESRDKASRPDKARPNGRGDSGEIPGETATPAGREPVAGADRGKGGLRKRPDREGDGAADAPAVTGRKQPEGRGVDQPGGNGAEQPQDPPVPRVPGKIAERQGGVIEKPGNAGRGAAIREAQEAQEAARRQARQNAEDAARGNTAREGVEKKQGEREQAESARAAAERAQRQRGAAKMNEARENEGRAARENAAREQAANAAAARRAQIESENEAKSRAANQAEAAQRQAAQRASENAARRDAAERQNENARRQIMERQNDNARQQAMERQAQARAAQQNEGRQRAAEAMQERAMNAQRQQAAEMNRARAMENQQRAAEAAQSRAQAKQEAQQRASAENAGRRQSESRNQSGQDGQENRRKKRGD